MTQPPKDKPDKPFECPHCGRAFKSKYNMQNHAQLHFSRKNFICEECGAAFHARKTLQSHMAHVHSDRRDFHCMQCPLSFKTEKSLKGHLLIHRGCTHKCVHCGSMFNRQNNLRRHIRKMHGTEEGLPPPKTVKLLDVPEGMEFHKGSVAYFATHPRPRVEPQPRRRRVHKVAQESNVDLEIDNDNSAASASSMPCASGQLCPDILDSATYVAPSHLGVGHLSPFTSVPTIPRVAVTPAANVVHSNRSFPLHVTPRPDHPNKQTAFPVYKH